MMSEMVAPQSPPIFPEEEVQPFYREFIQLLERKIVEELRTPGKFIDWAFLVRMTDYNPAEILDEAFTKIDVELIIGYYPTNYLVYLKIDRKETLRKENWL